MNEMLTTGRIAKALNCPLWQVQYLINSRNIKPDCKAGNLRVFNPDVLQFLRGELKSLKPGRKKKLGRKLILGGTR